MNATGTGESPNTTEKERLSRRQFLGAVVAVSLLAACSPENEQGEQELEQKQGPEQEQELGSEEELELEKLRQRSFQEDYAAEYSGLFGDRLYNNEELLDPEFSPGVPGKDNFELTPELRALHYFLRNGRNQTLAVAEQLSCQHRQTVLDSSHPIENIFKDAGIDIEREEIDWLEVPDGRNGSMSRQGDRYGGKTEIVMVVEEYTGELDDYIEQPAQEAGFEVDPERGHYGLIANEIMHEIQDRYFSGLFSVDNGDRLDEPFASFAAAVPDLRFRNNAQAAEFLSDVSHWVASGARGASYRFFNPLYYMDPANEYYEGREAEDDRYWYSYQVQKYAMEEALRQKGEPSPEAIVESLIQQAGNSNYENHDELFVLAGRHFTEDDFEKIAQIYRDTGVELLKTLEPYFSKPQER